MKNQTHCTKKRFLYLFVLVFFTSAFYAQDATIAFGSWATTQTFNSATATEVTIALGGGAALSSKKPCQEAANASVPSISSNNTHYVQGAVPNATGATIDHITFHVSGNNTGTTSYTNYVYYCTEATFNVSNVLGYTAFTFTGYDQACANQTVTFPAGVKSFRIYRRAKVSGSGPYIVETGTDTGDGQTMNFHDISVWLSASGCTTTGSFASAAITINLGDAFPGNVFTTTNTSPQVWTSSNTGIATVNASTGAVTLGAATGSTIIRVTQITDGTYCAVDKQYTLNVNPAGGCTAFSGTNGSVTKTIGDADFTISPTVNNTSSPTYSSSNAAVATIVAGKVHVVAAGSSIITLTYAADGTYCAGTVDYALTVNASGGGGTDYTYNCENFDNGATVVGTNFAGATGTWTISSGAINTTYFGTSPNSIKLSSSRQVTSPNLPNGAGTVSLWVRADGGGRVVKVATSTDGTTFTNACTSASITNGSTTTYSCPINNASVRYVRITLDGTSEVDDICITPGVVPPTLSASPVTITGLQKNLFNATNSTGQFTLTGANLTANAILTAPAGFEISLNNSTWSTTTLTATQTAGVINQIVYVRIATSTLGNISGDVTFTSVDVAGITPVNVSGKVVNAAPLSTPAKPTVSVPTATGFTGTWTAVPNATTYTLAVYDGATLVKTITGVSGTTSNITGLLPGTSYTFTVMAEANATYANSNPSPNSNAIVTLAPPVSTSACGSSMISLYSTDFTNWDDRASSGSNSDVVQLGGSGGFTGNYKPIVSSTGTIGGQTGHFNTGSNPSNAGPLFSPPFSFVSGGTVVLEIVHGGTSSGRKVAVTVDGSNTGVTAAITSTPVMGSTPASVSGNQVDLGQPAAAANGKYVLTYTLPAGLTGNHTVEIVMSNSDSYITKMSVCTNPGASCQLATTPVKNTTVNFSAEIGANTDVQFIELKGFNLGADVNVTISGSGAGRFSIPSATIAQAVAAGGTMIPITYTSSVIYSTHDAVITFSSGSCSSLSINLHGTSHPAGAGCAITTPIADLLFATRIISTTSRDILISGVNLTGNVTLAITGAGAGQFALSQSTVPATQANAAGKAVTITYTGGITVVDHTANLVITNGACSVTVPLLGRTLNFLPTMYTLTTIAQPAEGGVLVTDIAGPQYPSGTVVKLTAVAEAGYKFVRWSDITSYSATRNITMSSNKIITAIFAPSSTDGAKGDLEAYNITAVTATGFTANWKLVTGATLYTVNVFEQDINGLPGTLVKTQTSAGTSVAITGLTTGKAYFYQVVANSPLGDTSEMLGSYPIGALQPIVCGQE